MDAEPSIVCDGSGAHGRMKAVAGVMVVVFVLGVPIGFAALLVYYRREMQADQFLRVWGEGDSSVTNPNVHIRRRYRKLYEVRPSIVQLPETIALVRLRHGECVVKTSWLFRFGLSADAGLQTTVHALEIGTADSQTFVCRRRSVAQSCS